MRAFIEITIPTNYIHLNLNAYLFFYINYELCGRYFVGTKFNLNLNHNFGVHAYSHTYMAFSVDESAEYI